MGMDPTVELFDDPTYLAGHPRFRFMKYEVSSLGSTYETLGDAPLWTSMSLLGCGSSTWLVTSPDLPEHTLVLKNAWRMNGRCYESGIYEALEELGSHPSISKFVEGEDVLFRSRDGYRSLNITEIRAAFGLHPAEETLSLHRTVIDSPGTALWQYTSTADFALCLKDLIKGELRPSIYLAAVSKRCAGFQFFAHHGIIHHNINAGNLFLAMASSLTLNLLVP